MKAATVFAFVVCFSLAAIAQEDPTPRSILDHIDDLYRGKSAHAIMRMRVVTENWTRELELESWSMGKENSLMRILAPQKEKDTATLKSGKQMWNYLPKVNRIIKVPSSMMGSSWMGSHFTNDDLVKESRMAEDYDFEYGKPLATGEVLIICLPKPEAPVVWGKVVVQVRKSDWMPLTVGYFDEDMELARTMEFGDFEKVNDRLLPLHMRMIPADKPNERTEVRYEKIEFDLPISDDFFSLRSLRK